MTKTRNDRIRIRRKEADLRQAAWAQLTFAQQLADLDRRLGKDNGAVKQRKRITTAAYKKKVKS